MGQLLTLSRAARLVGVTRGALQKKIKVESRYPDLALGLRTGLADVRDAAGER